jgi:hypothetical protein
MAVRTPVAPGADGHSWSTSSRGRDSSVSGGADSRSLAPSRGSRHAPRTDHLRAGLSFPLFARRRFDESLAVATLAAPDVRAIGFAHTQRCGSAESLQPGDDAFLDGDRPGARRASDVYGDPPVVQTSTSADSQFVRGACLLGRFAYAAHRMLRASRVEARATQSVRPISAGLRNQFRVRIWVLDLTDRCRRSVSPPDHRTQRTAPPLAVTSTNDRSHHELDHRLLLRECVYRASRPLRCLRQHPRPGCHPGGRKRHRRARACGTCGRRCRFPASNASPPARLDGRHSDHRDGQSGSNFTEVRSNIKQVR